MLLTAALISGAAVAVPAMAAHPDDVRRCVAQNLVKYSAPDRAAVAQYVDVEAACRAALDGEATGGIVIAADPQAAPGARGGTGADGASADSDAGAPAAGGGGSDGDGDGRGEASSGRPPAASGSPSSADGAADQPEILARSLRLDSAEAGGPGLFSGTPAWLLAVIGAVVAAGLAATAIGRSRPSR